MKHHKVNWDVVCAFLVPLAIYPYIPVTNLRLFLLFGESSERFSEPFVDLTKPIWRSLFRKNHLSVAAPYVICRCFFVSKSAETGHCLTKFAHFGEIRTFRRFRRFKCSPMPSLRGYEVANARLRTSRPFRIDSPQLPYKKNKKICRDAEVIGAVCGICYPTHQFQGCSVFGMSGGLDHTKDCRKGV